MTTTPKALPALPEPDGHVACTADGSIIIPPQDFGKHNAYAIFTADQMRAYAQQAIADHLASVGGVEVVAWWNTKWSLGATIRELSEHKPDIGPMEETPAYKAGELEALIRQSDHLSALAKEREVADGLAEAVDEVVSFIVGELPSLGYLPDNNRTRAALGRLRAALTAHRGSRSEGKEAGHGNG